MYVWPMVFFLLVVGWGQAALAQTFDSAFKTWRVFSLVREKQKICYAISSPVEKTGTYKRRGAPYVVVTYRENNPAEVGVYAGYPYKAKSTVDITIDTQPQYAFFTTTKTPQIAWAQNTDEDKKIVEDMLKGSKMAVTGQAQTNASSTDTYALQGFSQAYKRMQARQVRHAYRKVNRAERKATPPSQTCACAYLWHDQRGCDTILTRSLFSWLSLTS